MPEQEQYLLSSHVHLCVAGGSIVLLDLRQDRYLAVGPSQSEALGRRVRGWPSTGSGRWDQVPTQASLQSAHGARALLDNMLAKGMLTTDCLRGREATPVRLARPERTLVRPDLEIRPTVRASFLANLARAVMMARWNMRRRSIQSLVGRIQRRKQRRASGDETFDLEQAEHIVQLFVYLRPLFFAARNACLFDCQVLIELMSYYWLFPCWVFGVMTKPFGAHCWIQADDVVLNDVPENVRRFEPILVV